MPVVETGGCRESATGRGLNERGLPTRTLTHRSSVMPESIPTLATRRRMPHMIRLITVAGVLAVVAIAATVVVLLGR